MKISPIFDNSASTHLTWYQNIPWKCSLGENLLSYHWTTIKFRDLHHNSTYLMLYKRLFHRKEQKFLPKLTLRNLKVLNHSNFSNFEINWKLLCFFLKKHHSGAIFKMCLKGWNSDVDFQIQFQWFHFFEFGKLIAYFFTKSHLHSLKP